jgi:hypothetical protein
MVRARVGDHHRQPRRDRRERFDRQVLGPLIAVVGSIVGHVVT